jgi:hypothetical protein
MTELANFYDYYKLPNTTLQISYIEAILDYETTSDYDDLWNNCPYRIIAHYSDGTTQRFSWRSSD